MVAHQGRWPENIADMSVVRSGAKPIGSQHADWLSSPGRLRHDWLLGRFRWFQQLLRLDVQRIRQLHQAVQCEVRPLLLKSMNPLRRHSNLSRELVLRHASGPSEFGELLPTDRTSSSGSVFVATSRSLKVKQARVTVTYR